MRWIHPLFGDQRCRAKWRSRHAPPEENVPSLECQPRGWVGFMVRVVCTRNSTRGSRAWSAAGHGCKRRIHDKVVVGVLELVSIVRGLVSATGGMTFFMPAPHVAQQHATERHRGKSEEDAGALVLGEGDPYEAAQNGQTGYDPADPRNQSGRRSLRFMVVLDGCVSVQGALSWHKPVFHMMNDQRSARLRMRMCIGLPWPCPASRST